MQHPTVTRRDLLDILNHVESKYPVETWKVNGVHIWPLVKINIFFRHVKAEGRDATLSALVVNQANPSHLKKALKALRGAFRFMLLLMRRKRKINVFFSDSSSRRELFDGIFINRFYKPIIEHLQAEEQTFTYLTINADRKDLERYPEDEPLFFIRHYFLGAILLRKLIGKKSHDKQTEGFDNFINEISGSKLAYLKVDKKYLREISHQVNEILAISSIVKVLIKKHRPEVIFELCYYDLLQLGISHAASEMGVKTVEIQHGGMGRDHVSYSGWKKLPKGGYNVFPQTFWLWDESSKQLIEKWIGRHNFHRAVLGGNPWVSYIKGKIKQDPHRYSFPEKKRIILYTLQFDEIPSHVMDAIKDTPSCFQWWIRLHPRKLESKPIITKLLSDFGLNSCCFEIDKATSYPLPVILSHSYIHISGFSGSIIEAAQLGVCSIITEEVGLIYYSDLIRQGKARPGLRKEEILQSILLPSEANRFQRVHEKSYELTLKKLRICNVPKSNN